MPTIDTAHICKMYQNGKTQAEIAAAVGVTRQRIQQYLVANGLRKHSGGAYQRSQAKEQLNAAHRDTVSRRRWGLSLIENKQIRSKFGRKPFIAFKEQRINARNREIVFDLTFAQWWSLWCGSGKWSNRGRSKNSYVMTRPGDQGPYAIGNIVIKTLSENTAEYRSRCRTTTSSEK